MTFYLKILPTAKATLKELKDKPDLEKRYKAVTKTLSYLAENPKHPGLKTHSFTAFRGPKNEKVFEAYAENDTPGAYRIFFCYGSQRGEIVILAITPHP